jgi:hypothetical protein
VQGIVFVEIIAHSWVPLGLGQYFLFEKLRWVWSLGRRLLSWGVSRGDNESNLDV